MTGLLKKSCRPASFAGNAADRIEQRIVGPAAGRELDTDHPGVETAGELRQSVACEVGIDDGVAPNTRRIGTLKLEQEVVAVFDVGRGR